MFFFFVCFCFYLPCISLVQSTAIFPWSLQPFHVREGKRLAEQKLRLKCTTFLFCMDRRLTQPTLDLQKSEKLFNKKHKTHTSPHVRESGFRNPGTFCSWNPESWALESGIQH